MCFSPQADLVSGIVVGAIGVDVVRHVPRRHVPRSHGHLLLASLPLLFAAHQLDEAVVWWSLQGHIPHSVGRVAVWAYLLFAFVVLPTLVPTAILLLEPPGRRHQVISGLLALGVSVSAVLLIDMLRGPITATLGSYHVAYSTTPGAGGWIVAVYVVATCGAMLLSGYRDIAMFGVVNLVAVVLLTRITMDGLASLWCGWAAVTSGAIALHMRFANLRRPIGVAQ